MDAKMMATGLVGKGNSTKMMATGHVGKGNSAKMMATGPVGKGNSCTWLSSFNSVCQCRCTENKPNTPGRHEPLACL